MIKNNYIVREHTSGDKNSGPDYEYGFDTLAECAEKIEKEMRYNARFDYRRSTVFTVVKAVTTYENVPFHMGGVTFNV